MSIFRDQEGFENYYSLVNEPVIRTQFNRHSNWLQCNALGGQ